jgi:hypothetical protein
VNDCVIIRKDQTHRSDDRVATLISTTMTAERLRQAITCALYGRLVWAEFWHTRSGRGTAICRHSVRGIEVNIWAKEEDSLSCIYHPGQTYTGSD